MIELQQGDAWTERGRWTRRLFHDGTTEPPLRSAHVCCPGCGQTMSLRNHHIASDGTVTPSVVCGLDCGFHDMVKLVGWTG